MKLILLLAFSIMLMASCNKSATSPSRSPIIGQWELRETDGSLSGKYIYPPGNGEIIIFDASGNYTQVIQGSINEKGSYRILSGPWPLGGHILAVTIKDSLSSNVSAYQDHVVITDKQLIIFPIPMGPYTPTWYYARIN
jgi:hypothetical protein